MINWPVELLSLHALNQEYERITKGFHKATLFNAHADLADIEKCEQAIAIQFDTKHRDFLLHANGWDAFSSDIDIFSTNDFFGSERFKQAKEWIQLMDRGVLGSYTKYRSNLLPIGKSVGSTDLLLMLNQAGSIQPKVLWFANELIEEFLDFDEMFVSFKAYAPSKIEFWNKRMEDDQFRARIERAIASENRK